MGGKPRGQSGTYLIVLRFDEGASMKHPKLGRIELGPVGLYAGSGQGGTLDKQVRRRLSGSPDLRHYHVDYASPLAIERQAIRRVGRSRVDEHGLAQALLYLPGAIPVPGFGSTDCTSGCVSHYVHIPLSSVPAAVQLARAPGDISLALRRRDKWDPVSATDVDPHPALAVRLDRALWATWSV